MPSAVSDVAPSLLWNLKLTHKTVAVETRRTAHGYYGVLDQGTPQFLGTVDDRESLASGFGLTAADLNPNVPLEIVSTGLRYLIISVLPGALERAHITRDITPLLASVGAQFAVLLDEAAVEIRHWNNDGIVEDVATGSAAGTIGAYRLRHGLVAGGQPFILNQGRFTGRPSTLRVWPEGAPDEVTSVKVGGDVALVGCGELRVLP